MNNKIEFINFSGNLGNELIKKIYAYAYKLEASKIVVKKSKYNRCAILNLYCMNDCICENYVLSL